MIACREGQRARRMVGRIVMRRNRVWMRKPEFTLSRVHAPPRMGVHAGRCMYLSGGSKLDLVQTTVGGEMECVERILKQKRGRRKVWLR